MIKKLVKLHLLFIALTCTQPLFPTFTAPTKDALGRTPVMNYIIEQEKLLQIIQGSTSPDQQQKIEQWLKKTCETLLDMIHEEDIIELKTDDQGNIFSKSWRIINHGPEILNEKDNEGKTAIDFTTNSDVYNFLREQGASFQMSQWIRLASYETKFQAFLSTVSMASLLGFGIAKLTGSDHASTLWNTWLGAGAVQGGISAYKLYNLHQTNPTL